MRARGTRPRRARRSCPRPAGRTAKPVPIRAESMTDPDVVHTVFERCVAEIAIGGADPPRGSKVMTRENDARRRMKFAISGTSHIWSTLETSPNEKTKSSRPSPKT